jgi:hypothetical protein
VLAKRRQQTFEDAVCSDLGLIAIQNPQLSKSGLNTDRPRFGTATWVMMHRQPQIVLRHGHHPRTGLRC